MKKKAVTIIIIISIVIALLAAAVAVFHFTRPSVNIVLTDAENLLFGDVLPSGIFERIRVKKSIYPDVKSADYTLYSPYAAAHAVNDGAVIAESSAVWGLSDEELPFDLVFLPNEEARWRDAYINTDSPLLTAVIYNSSSETESAIAAAAPSSVLKYSYEGTMSRVAAEQMMQTLKQSGVSALVIYSPVNTMELLSSDEGYTLILPLLYAGVFETLEPAYFAAEDFNEMFSILIEGSTGRVETPYVLLPFKKGIEVFLDKLF